jgi:hypothetical protein
MAPGQILALVLASARVDEVGAAAILTEGVGFRAGKVIAIAALQFVGVAIVARDQNMAPFEGLPPNGADSILFATAFEWCGDIATQFDAIGIGLRDDIDHACDRVRTVDR